MFGQNALKSRRLAVRRRAGGVASAMVVLMAAGSAVSATAEDRPFTLRAGAILANVDTSVRVDPTRVEGIGAELDLESDLGLSDSPGVGFVELGYRFAPRWTVNVQYLRLSRNRSINLAREITVGDTVFPIDARVGGSFASNLYKAHVTWSLVRNDKAEVGLSLGAHVTDFSLAVEGEGTVGEVAGAAREERREITAPLPNVGVSASYELAPRLTVVAKANYLQLRIDELEGGLTDIEANLAYEVTDRLAIGAGFRRLEYRLDVERDRFEGRVRYAFEGPFAFVTASF